MGFRWEHTCWNRFKEIGEGDRLVALGAGGAGANTQAEGAAVVAPVSTEVACRASWALVDRRQPRCSRRQRWQRSRVTLAKSGLSAGGIAETLPF